MTNDDAFEIGSFRSPEMVFSARFTYVHKYVWETYRTELSGPSGPSARRSLAHQMVKQRTEYDKQHDGHAYYTDDNGVHFGSLGLYWLSEVVITECQCTWMTTLKVALHGVCGREEERELSEWRSPRVLYALPMPFSPSPSILLRL